jgi:hypothetical protein
VLKLKCISKVIVSKFLRQKLRDKFINDERIRDSFQYIITGDSSPYRDKNRGWTLSELLTIFRKRK